MATCLRLARLSLFPPKPLLTATFPSQIHIERLPTLRRKASTKAQPLPYKPAPPSSKKSHTAPPTGFAAIASYDTIARRYKFIDRGSSCTNGAPRWVAIMVGIPVVVVTSYELYKRCMSLMTSIDVFGLTLLVVLGQEQKPLSTLPEGPLQSRDV